MSSCNCLALAGLAEAVFALRSKKRVLFMLNLTVNDVYLIVVLMTCFSRDVIKFSNQGLCLSLSLSVTLTEPHIEIPPGETSHRVRDMPKEN